MANGDQSDSQFDAVQHPVLGPLKFPKDMPFEERNESIQRALARQPASQGVPSVPPQKGPQPPQPSLASKIWQRANEPLTMGEVEKIPGIEPERAEMLRQYDAAITGKSVPETSYFDKEVLARAAAKTLTDFYSPVQFALRGLGVAASKPTASVLTRAAAAGVAAPIVGQQAYGLAKNWSQMTPAERVASGMGIAGGTILGTVGIGAEIARGRSQPTQTQPTSIAQPTEAASVAEVPIATVKPSIEAPLKWDSAALEQIATTPTKPADQAQALRSDSIALSTKLRNGVGSPQERAIAEQRLIQNAQMIKTLDMQIPDKSESIPFQVAPTVPSVRTIKPRYGYQDKNFELQFANETDKALYTLAQTTKNKIHDQVLSELRPQFPNESNAQLEARGRAIRESIKPLAKTNDPADGPLQVPVHSAVKPPQVAEYAPKPEEVARPSVAKEIPSSRPLSESFDKMVSLKRDLEGATTDEQRTSLSAAREKEAARARDTLRHKLSSSTPEQLVTLREEVSTAAERHSTQAEAARNLADLHERNAENVESLTALRAKGGPVREMVIDEAGNRAVVKEQADLGPGSRGLLDEMQNRVPRVKPENLIIKEKPAKVSQEAWDSVVGKLQDKRAADRASIMRDITVMQDTGLKLEETDIPSRLKDLDDTERMLGRYPEAPAQPGRRPHQAPPIDAAGKVVDPGSLWQMDLKTANRIAGKQFRKMPSMDDIRRIAADKDELARLHNAMLGAIDKTLSARQGERGALGESALPSLPRATEKDLEGPALMRRAFEIGASTWEVSHDKPAGYEGWLSRDGKHFIEKGPYTHSEIAKQLLPQFEARGSAHKAMKDYGWIRKDGLSRFDVNDLNPRVINTIEMDTLRSGLHGHDVLIDFRSGNKSESVYLDAGWTDLADAIAKEKRKLNITDESGKISGTEMAAGGAVGGAVGFAVGGPVGGAIGWTLGSVTPALLRSKPVADVFARWKPALDNMGISAKDWILGSKQYDPILPTMRAILDKQKQDIEGSHIPFLQRIAQLPTDARSAFIDRLNLMNDQTGPLGRFVKSLDTRGQLFRQGQKPSIDDSPYISLYNAATSIHGEQSFNAIQYSKVYGEVIKAKAGNHFTEYLNLTGYKRVYDVLQERMQEGASKIIAAHQALQDPNLSPRDRVKLEDDLSEARTEVKAIRKKVVSGEAVPMGYTPNKIAQDMATLRSTLGPDKFAQIENWAQRSVFSRSRYTLDMLHDYGVLSEKDYKTFTGRGDKYIAMNRILSDLADNNARWSPDGKGSPLYLRQQNVIRAIEGSERVNRDPLSATLAVNNEAIAEALRNRTIGEYIDAAQKDPKGIGQYFKAVSSSYRAQKGEALVGHYINGQPKTYAVPDWLSESLQGSSLIVNNLVGGAMARFTYKVASAGATALNLGFSMMRPFTDITRMAILSEAGVGLKTFPKDWTNISIAWARNLRDSIAKNPAWEEAVRQGYTFSGAQRNISPEGYLGLQRLGFGAKIAKMRIIDTIKDFNASIEDSIKMTAFQRLREQGLSEKAATYETKRYGGAPDYSRKGNLSPTANLLTMFFNADMQHISQAFEKAAENPKRIVPILGALTAMTLMLDQHNWGQKDDKGEPLMRKVPYDIRERDFVFLTGETQQTRSGATVPVYYRIRKPDVVALMINPIQNTLSKLLGREERTGVQLAIDAVQHLTPFTGARIQKGQVGTDIPRAIVASSNPLYRVPAEELMNYRTGGEGGPIVSQRLSNLDPTYQFSPGTSRTAIRLGQLTGLSPQRIQHVAGGLTGGLGVSAMNAIDPFMGKRPTLPAPEGSPEALRQMPVIGGLMSRVSASPIDQQERNLETKFYDGVQQITVPYHTFDMLMKTDPTQAVTYMKAHQDTVWKGRLASQMQVKLGEINTMQRMLEENPNIPDAQRATALKNVHAAKMRILQAFSNFVAPTTPTKTGESTLGTTAR
jgi:hypothetical protein